MKQLVNLMRRIDAVADAWHEATRDAHELLWWRRDFACRCGPNGLPRVGRGLYGHRFVLMVKLPDGELVPWAEYEARGRRS